MKENVELFTEVIVWMKAADCELPFNLWAAFVSTLFV